MIVFPNAKINLGLSVVRKREDGYHDLETIFYPIALKDILEIMPRDDKEVKLNISGIESACEVKDNLVVKAYNKVKEKFDIPGIDIYLHKIIPSGAGMGGGSSDASFMIKGLIKLFDLNISEDECEKISGTLGADCPFFIKNHPVFAEGTGDVFSPVRVSLKGYKIVVIKPSVSVPTKDAFGGIKPRNPEMQVKNIVENYPVNNWREMLVNDFEDTVFRKYPEIRNIKEKLYSMGAVYCSMSGSGSSVYALFKEIPDLENHFDGCFKWSGDCEI